MFSVSSFLLCSFVHLSLLPVGRCAVARVTRSHIRGSRMSPEEAQGAKLGDTVRESGNALTTEVARGTGPTYMASMGKQLDADSEVLVNPRVTEAVTRANNLAAASTPKDYLCVRDWAQTCPDGWQLVGRSCRAPTFYEGGCQSVAKLLGASVVEKRKFAEDCSAPWPCADECSMGRNYEKEPCPKGWGAGVGEGVCESDEGASADPNCGTKYRFVDMQISTRQELAIQCAIAWPCSEVCVEDFGAACPEGWVSVADGFCEAPATYGGDCSFGLNATALTLEQKKAFANKCAANFPCMDKDAIEAMRKLAAASESRQEELGDGPVDFETGRIVEASPTL